MKKLYVFMGKPGCGKTTILKSLGVKYYDVLYHIKRYFDENGRMDEANTIKAYHDLFKELKGLNEEKVFLELGTNHTEFVMKNLQELQVETTIFFCLLNNEECLRRNKIGNNPMPEDALMRRIARVFPDDHLQFISEMKYYNLDMGKSIEENLLAIKNII
ncbi:MAG: hypothetical protein ABIH82_00230 [Candidatus Woesearchaeota archaeon]